jgi:hypothetical protein
MSIRQQLRSRLGASGQAFECDCCALTFDRDRLNCPACGGAVQDAR